MVERQLSHFCRRTLLARRNNRAVLLVELRAALPLPPGVFLLLLLLARRFVLVFLGLLRLPSLLPLLLLLLCSGGSGWLRSLRRMLRGRL
jgi:hypothetical protein